MFNWMNSHETLWLKDLLISSLFLISVFVLRTLLVRLITHMHGPTHEMRLRWLVNIRNAMLLVALVGLTMIWSNELQTLAISLAAVAAAMVLATRELILCFSGGLWRAGSKAYSVGDRVNVGKFRGDVVDINLFATTLMELGPGNEAHQYTGRAVVLPNSMLLSEPVATESYTGPFSVRVLRIPLTLRDDWRAAERKLLEISYRECADYLEAARLHMKKMERNEGFDTPSVDPRIVVELPEPDRVDLLLRVPVQKGREGRVTQAILHRFLAEFPRHDTSAHASGLA